MKILIRYLSVIIIIAGLFNGEKIMASEKTQKQKYTVVYSDKELEIRFYPAATLATVYSEADSYRELSYSGFRTLAGYIFGGNESGTKISMTSPVQMDINETQSAMSFVMPEGYTIDNLPKPDDSRVVVHSTTNEYVAAIKFGGFASDADIRNYSEKLRDILVSRNIVYKGNFRFLGYDSPFRLTGRRNEIIVTVEWDNK
jgi:hypothetical protein